MSRYDVLVIGGGLTGVATACYLARGGMSVLLVEQQQLNRGASGRNAGSLHFQLEHRLIEYEGVLDEQLSYYAALARLAIADWRALEAELGQPVELEMTGGLMLAESTDQMRKLERKAAIETAQGVNVSLLSRAEVMQHAPYLSDSIVGALHCPDEGHCNPRLLTHAYARRAEQHGATLQTQTAVRSLMRNGTSWSAVLESEQRDQTVVADVIVNAAGTWAGDVASLAGVKLPVIPVALMISVTEKVPVIMRHLIQHVGRKLSLKQVDDGNLLIGGGWLARLPPRAQQLQLNYRATPDMHELKKNLLTARNVMPMIGDVHILRSWTGTTALTPDQLPIIGESEEAPGFYTAVGGSGFTYGPTYARLLAELIGRGETSFPITAYSPGRFADTHGVVG